jgi:hypothetical protein
MPRDFFDPTPDQQNVILIDAATLRKAEVLIHSCEHCNPEGAPASAALRLSPHVFASLPCVLLPARAWSSSNK